MRGSKDHIFSFQDSESFHQALKHRGVRDSPVVYIPEMIIQWEHRKLSELQVECEKEISKGNTYPDFLEKIIKHRSGIKTSVYDIIDMDGDQFQGRVTSRYEIQNVSH